MVRGFLRRLFMGLCTVLGISARGFFIPYRYAGDAAPGGTGCFTGMQRMLADREPVFLHMIHRLNDPDGLAPDLLAIGDQPPPEPRWGQDWFPGLDGAVAYGMVRLYRPARIVEVGSGHSTRFFARAVRDGKLDTAITAIDPAPRADLGQLDVRLLQTTLQKAGTAPFEGLTAGDILSVDSSHILMPGSDVDLLLNGIFPLLPDGVLVHIHDIFLPDGYPESWRWRGYNEQLAVAALLEGTRSEILWASHYASTRMAASLEQGATGKIRVPDDAFGTPETSLWFRKRGFAPLN